MTIDILLSEGPLAQEVPIPIFKGTGYCDRGSDKRKSEPSLA